MSKILKSTTDGMALVGSNPIQPAQHQNSVRASKPKRTLPISSGVASKPIDSRSMQQSQPNQQATEHPNTKTITQLNTASKQLHSIPQSADLATQDAKISNQPQPQRSSQHSQQVLKQTKTTKQPQKRLSQSASRTTKHAALTKVTNQPSIEQVSIQNSPAAIEQIFQTLQQLNPEPDTELHYANDFTLLVSIILSAQSTDLQVNKVTEVLFKTVQTPEDILKLGLEALKQSINSLGLYNAKANNILHLSEILVEQYHSTVPTEHDILTTLPGVGQKTANVFLNVAYHQPFIGVDTHVARLSYRLGLIDRPLTNPAQIEEAIKRSIPTQYHAFVNHWLVLHGRYICKAKQPQCCNCPLAKYCPRNGLELK